MSGLSWQVNQWPDPLGELLNTIGHGAIVRREVAFKWRAT